MISADFGFVYRSWIFDYMRGISSLFFCCIDYGVSRGCGLKVRIFFLRIMSVSVSFHALQNPQLCLAVKIVFILQGGNT